MLFKYKRSIAALCVMGMITSTAFAGEGTVYYDASIKAPSLGNYQFNVETHEIPSHEYLPIVSKDYFPVTTAQFQTEVDNTAPSATYEAKALTKVDVVFAFGDMSQAQTMQDNIPNFEAMLNAAGNNIDAYVQKIETVSGGFDIDNVDAQTILDTWTKWPANNQFTVEGTQLRSNGANQGFTLDEECQATKLVMEADLKAHSLSLDHACGFVVNWNMDSDTAIFVASGNTATLVCHVTGVSNMWGKYMGPLCNTSGGSSSGNGFTITVIGRSEHLNENRYRHTKFELNGNNYTLWDDSNVITGTIPVNSSGVNGVYCSCTGWINNIQISYETKVIKSLGESITDVAWRDNSVRFIVYGEDKLQDWMKTHDNSEYQYTVTKLLNSGAYLLPLGTVDNRDKLDGLIKRISLDGTTKGKFFYNSPINTALNSANSYIINTVRNMEKSTQWILVNTEITWKTLYNDQEHDLPLNFGEHDGSEYGDTSDKVLASTWGVPFTQYYKGDKILAEKWRFRHNYTYYDNYTQQETFHDVWLSDPVDIFPEPGLYRINYKRKDNPFYSDISFSNPFDEYRYWSTDYDPVVQEE